LLLVLLLVLFMVLVLVLLVLLVVLLLAAGNQARKQHVQHVHPSSPQFLLAQLATQPQPWKDISAMWYSHAEGSLVPKIATVYAHRGSHKPGNEHTVTQRHCDHDRDTRTSWRTSTRLGTGRHSCNTQCSASRACRGDLRVPNGMLRLHEKSNVIDRDLGLCVFGSHGHGFGSSVLGDVPNSSSSTREGRIRHSTARVLRGGWAASDATSARHVGAAGESNPRQKQKHGIKQFNWLASGRDDCDCRRSR
jgi:hypothetical protein